MSIVIYNSLKNTKEKFIPINKNNIKLYVCGPTVYDYPHIGNARSVVVYDIIYRILKHFYKRVTYVRNITDIDDKIIIKAHKDNKSIQEIVTYYSKVFDHNAKFLNCLSPDIEPKVTDHIDVIIEMIKILIANGHAYQINGNVYFDIRSCKNYGILSGRKIENSITGSRITVKDEKKHPEDFILWKKDEKFWDSPWSKGRPGWHIECSAMSNHYLGKNFDIHGGGEDLQFPHHENEIAQSTCANVGSIFAKYWIHNGFITIDGHKMSKSLGNVITIKELYDNKIDGKVIRYALLNTHYKKPLDWNSKIINAAAAALKKIYNVFNNIGFKKGEVSRKFFDPFIKSLYDDFNTPKAISEVHNLVSHINSLNIIESNEQLNDLMYTLDQELQFIGLEYRNDIKIEQEEIEHLIMLRNKARNNKDYTVADKIREQLLQKGIILMDKEGRTNWYKKI